MTTAAQKIAAVSDWVGSSYPPGLDEEAHLWRRVAKISEENGEVTEALLGAIGENPRKGVTNGFDKVEYELLDVATCALGALHKMAPDDDVIERLAAHADHVWRRAGLNTEEAPDGVAE